MFWELFRFELYYRRRRATTYVYFVLTFIVSFITIASPTLQVAGTADTTSANAPYTISALMVVLSFLFSIITSSLLGVSIIRDVEHNMAPILFTTTIRKGSYLFGRFVGSLVTLIVINIGVILGALTAYLLGKVLPWDIAWLTKEILPFSLWTYLQPFLLFTVSNIFITGSLFFAAGALIRKPIVIYSQGIALLMIYQVANTFYLRDLEYQRISALLDPFGVQTFIYTTRYWTPAEQNSLLVPFADVMLYNRLIWFSIAVVVLAFTWWRFTFTSRRNVRKIKEVTTLEPTQPLNIPRIMKPTGSFSPVRQILSLTRFLFRGIWIEVPFMAILGTGLLVLFVNAARMDNIYGTSSYPTTTAVLTMLASFWLFFLIIVVFYSGEMMWKEREAKIQSITDAAPAANGVVMVSKFLSLCLVYLTLLSGFFLFGIILQASRGYYQFDLQAYFGTLFGETFLTLCLITVVSMLIQVLAGNKFMGFVVTVLVVILVAMLPLFGIEHEMVSYGSGSLGVFSQMNGFGHFVIPFFWLKSYWVALAVLFFIPAVILYRRGSENKMMTNLKVGFRQFNGSTRIAGIAGAIVFFGCGGWIYYNTSVVNHFESVQELKVKQVRYEKELKQFESTAQPTIVEIDLTVDLHPDQRSFEAKGAYYLANKTPEPIRLIQLQHLISPNINLHDVQFERSSTLVEDKGDLGYRMYEVTPPLAPGDSLRMKFSMEFVQKGFKSKPQNTDLVYNGTFLRSSYFPTIGYDNHHELSGNEDRRKFSLDPKNQASLTGNRSDKNAYGKEADRIRFKAVVSTEGRQTPLAPGRMTKKWNENNRNYRQYESNGTMPSFYAILSGNYVEMNDRWNDVDLNIFYHAGHNYNVGRMMQGLKDGLDYYTKNFGPFPDSQVSIVEFPRYSTLAQSFPGMIAFSEGAGFILKVADPLKDLDVPYYVTAHELAHQWWGQHVMEADSAGRTMLSEGMAQYSAMMVMKHSFPVEMMQLFLKYELDAYLKGRAAEKLKELPLQSVRGQQYIAYNKAALVFFTLQDYIGEDSVNAAFRRFHEKFAYQGPPYPTSKDLIEEIRHVTPDSLSYLIGDMFGHVTLYENKAIEAAYTQQSPIRYEVTMSVSTQKLQVNEVGKEVMVPLNDWIDVGIYGEDENGKPKLIYLRKHKFSREKNTLTIHVSSQPVKVGIDPLHKLIDHHSTDNVIPIGTVVELANSPIGY